MKHNLFLLGLIIVMGCAVSACSVLSSQQSQDNRGVEDHQIIALQVGGADLRVEAVTTVESITQGLGNRDEIGSDGMLFFLPEKRIATFWMKGMRFDLDMVWIDGDTVIGVTSNVPALENDTQKLQTYSSPSEVDYVLELPAGDAEKRGITSGDSVTISP